MNTIIYIDGFNLYDGAVKKTGYKWLDLQALCQMLLPKKPSQVPQFQFETTCHLRKTYS